MNDHPSTDAKPACDRIRIERFLDSDHYQLDDSELVEHLDSCEACRLLMEEQSAEAELRQAAEFLLRPHEFDKAGSRECSAATVTGTVARTVTVQEVIDTLSPTDDPHHLGRLGSYEVTGIIGVGGMGVVLKAVDPSLDRVVALKMLAPNRANNEKARKRFAREAKAAAAVLHPNVIPIHSVSSDSAVPYLVMAYIRGCSLQKRIESNGQLPLVEILRIGSQIAGGLAAAHDQGLIHRDIKPENVLLEEGVERVTITDFGLARAIDDNSVTQQGTIAGTPMYMSPEQARGDQLDQKSDLFSLGSVMYTLCTGRPPFRADSTLGVLRQIAEEQPIPIRTINPDIPAWLESIIERLMSKAKQDRHKSAEEVHELLEACLSHLQQPNAIKLPSITSTKFKSSVRPFLKSPFGVLAILTLATTTVLLAMFALQDPEKPTQADPQHNHETADAKIAADKVKNLTTADESNAENAQQPDSWTALGIKKMEGSSTDAITLINSMNECRGVWKIAGTVTTEGKETPLTGELRIAGGFKQALENGTAPGWQVHIKYSLNDQQLEAVGMLLALPEGGKVVKLLLNRRRPDSKRNELFMGTWDLPTRTLSFSDKGMAERIAELKSDVAKGNQESGPKDAAPDTSKTKNEESTFEIVFAEDGSIRYTENSTIADTKTVAIDASTTYRVKTPLEPFMPPKPDSERLPNGYRVFVASRSEIYVEDETGDNILGPNVAQIGSSGDMLFGKVVPHDKSKEATGYFVLNSGEGDRNLAKSLSEEEWIEELKKRGMTTAPVLVDSDKKRPRSDWGEE